MAYPGDFYTNLKDILLTSDGDLNLLPNGDIETVDNGDALAQHVMVCLRTYLNDASTFPGIGSIIEDFIGQPNTREVGTALENEVRRAILTSSIFDASVLRVTAVPISTQQMLLLVEPDTGNPNGGTLEFDIDLTTGNIT